MTLKNHTSRIGENFMKEINYIKNKRFGLGIDKKKKSIRWITDLIIRHEAWRKIKEDTIEFKDEFKKNNADERDEEEGEYEEDEDYE